MKRRLRRTLANPIFIVVPIIAILLLGWSRYVSSGRDLSLPTQNLLPNGSFDTFDADSVPSSWSITKTGTLDTQASSEPGYVSGKLLALQINHYKNGNLELRSPTVSLRPNTTYLYKGYYQTTVPFDLLVRYSYTNGTEQLRYIRTYPGDNGPWSTDSVAFQDQQNIKAVQFVYRVAANGTLKLNGTYLEVKASGVYSAPAPQSQNLLIPNGNLEVASGSQPSSWSSYRTGNNSTIFSYAHQPNTVPYVSVTTSNYHSGEAKWQYQPRAVVPGQAFLFGVDYTSTTTSSIVVEYVMANGTRQFDTLASLSPAGEWTHYQAAFEVPDGAVNAFVAIVLKSNGTLDTSNYALDKNNRAGPRQFQRPLVSLTFDDGWKSAFQNALPVMNTLGYTGTFYLNPSALGTNDFISTDQVKNLQAQGEEIGAHGYAHVDMTSINGSQLDYQLQAGRTVLQSITGGQASDFATPYGKSDAEVQYYARKYYQSLRSTDDGINTRQNFDPYDLKVLYLTDKTTEAQVKQALAQAEVYHGWLIFVYHRIQNSDSKTTAAGEDTVVTPANFRQQLTDIRQSGIQVETVGVALHELERQ